MIEQKVAVKDLLELPLAVLDHLNSGRQLDSFRFEDSWQQFKIARLRLFVGDLEIEAIKFGADLKGVIDVQVWNFSDVEELRYKFHIKGRIPHVSRVIADYINEYEAAA